MTDHKPNKMSRVDQLDYLITLGCIIGAAIYLIAAGVWGAA